MAAVQKHVTLRNGVQVPVIGLGKSPSLRNSAKPNKTPNCTCAKLINWSLILYATGTSHNGGYNHETVVYAIAECGYRLIDTAKRYGTEPLVAQAIEDAGVDRADMFIVTKVWPGDYGYDSTLRAFEGSAKRYQFDLNHCIRIH